MSDDIRLVLMFNKTSMILNIDWILESGDLVSISCPLSNPLPHY